MPKRCREEFLDPMNIHFTQSSVSKQFSNGELITNLLDEVLRGVTSVEDFPTLRVTEYAGQWYASGNRRLMLFKLLRTYNGFSSVPVQIVHWLRRGGSTDSARIRGGGATCKCGSVFNYTDDFIEHLEHVNCF